MSELGVITEEEWRELSEEQREWMDETFGWAFTPGKSLYNRDFLAVPKVCRGSWDFYAGLQYVTDDDIQMTKNYVVYHRNGVGVESGRVGSILDKLHSLEEEHESC